LFNVRRQGSRALQTIKIALLFLLIFYSEHAFFRKANDRNSQVQYAREKILMGPERPSARRKQSRTITLNISSEREERRDFNTATSVKASSAKQARYL
jgi:hypothetical protein